MTAPIATDIAAALADRYVLDALVGSGGMAQVYAADDLRHGRRVAIKVISSARAAGADRDRFLREVRVMARLSHPHIVPVFDSGEAAGHLFYVMPLVDGITLRARLTESGRFDSTEAVRIVRQVAGALDYAHREGVVHRDIKPENILLSQGHALVADFGIARLFGGGSTVTATGVAVGTLPYMSPEQLTGADAGPPADVYALGCVLFELLAGEAPFRATASAADLARRLVASPPLITARRPDVSGALADVIARAMTADATGRFTNAGDLSAALDAARGATGVATRPAHSLLVRPFEAIGSGADGEAVSDGLTEEVISDLAKVAALRVISRTTAMRFKGTSKDAGAIGAELGVRYVVSGSVRRAGEKVRVTAELVDTVLDAAVWSGKFDGDLADPFELQEHVARGIVNALKVRLTPDEERKLVQRPLADPRAHDAYRFAMRQVVTFTAEGLRRAVALLDEVMAGRDDQALLCAARGQVEWQHFNAGFDTDPRRVAEAERWLRRALAIEPDLPQALLGLAWIAVSRGEMPAGIRMLDRALDAGPLDSEAVAFCGVVDWLTGRWPHLHTMAARAGEIDPLHLWGLFVRGAVAARARDIAELDRLFRVTVGMEPEAVFVRLLWALLFLQCDERERAIVAAGSMDAQPTDMIGCFHLAVRAIARGDNASVRDLVLRPATAPLLDDAQWAWHVAELLAVSGHLDDALTILDRAVRQGMSNIEMLESADATLSPLRADPRFATVMERARAQRALVPTPPASWRP